MENTILSFDVNIIVAEMPEYFFDVSDMTELVFGIMRMLSRYTTRNSLTKSPKISFMRAWEVAGALVKPNGIRKYSNDPCRVLKAMRYSCPLPNQTRSLAPQRLVLVKIIALWKVARR